MRLLADENFNNQVVRALLRRHLDIDVVRVQDVGLSGADDAKVLEWAAEENRLLLTHDVRTIPEQIEYGLRSNLAMPGVVFVNRPFSVAALLEELELLILYSLPGEWEGRSLYLPSPLPGK